MVTGILCEKMFSNVPPPSIVEQMFSKLIGFNNDDATIFETQAVRAEETGKFNTRIGEL